MRPLHDPYQLIPDRLPERPRVYLTPSQIERARSFADSYAWAREGKEMLLARAEAGLGKPVELAGAESDYEVGQSADLMDQVIAYVLTEGDDYAAQAGRILRAAAQRQAEAASAGKKPASDQLRIAHAVQTAAGAYDLLYDSPSLTDADHELIEEMLLRRGIEALRDCGHLTCSNIRTWSLAGLLSVGLCLDDRETIHEALYGRFDEERSQQTFGVLHQISHDILADGFHWERSYGYHCYTLMALTYLARTAGNCGIDLWQLEVDALLRPEGHDQHRDYRPACQKTLKWMYDAPFYYLFPDGSCAEIHDSRGTPWYVEVYGPIYETAYEAYGDPKYAWLLNRIYEHRESVKGPDAAWTDPRSWQCASNRNSLFVTIGTGELPSGEFSLSEDAGIGFNGRHVNGSALFPSAGYAVLRSDTSRVDAPCVTMSYGPQSAGHQHACALHLSVYGQGERLLVDGARFGYSNLEHLTWSNQTIAHNTVVVDGTSMFPQLDHEGQNHQFEADTYYLGPVTDGTLECFHSGERLKVVRASNEAVYQGVRLDRTVAIVDAQYIVDVFRVISEEEHLYDFPLHGIGELDAGTCEDAAEAFGDRIGYRHLSEVRRLVLPGPWEITWRAGEVSLTAHRIGPTGAEMFAASDPAGEKDEPRAASIVRARGKSIVFVNVLEPRRGPAEILSVRCEDAGPGATVAVRVARTEGEHLLVSMPTDGRHSFRGATFDGQLALIQAGPKGLRIAEVVRSAD